MHTDTGLTVTLDSEVIAADIAEIAEPSKRLYWNPCQRSVKPATRNR